MVSIRRVDAPSDERTTVERLLADADEAFVPPLTGSARTDVSRSDAEGGRTDLEGYVDRCLDRPMVGAFDGEDLVGFASVRGIDDSDALDGYTPSTHVSILIVSNRYRGRGIATRLYRHLLEEPPSALDRPYVSTKTWSTNHAHLVVLDRLSFTCVKRIPDDRGPGIDTVYYARGR